MIAGSPLIAAALGVPLTLLLACASSALRRHMRSVLALAPAPALAAAMFGDWTRPLVLGNERFALTFAFDQPGAILLGSAAVLWMMAGAYAARWLHDDPKTGAFAVCWLMTLTGSIGVFLAADLVGFYFVLAVLSVGASGLVLQGDGAGARYASSLYFNLALLAEAFLLAGLLLLAAATPEGSLLIRDATAALPASPWRDTTLTLLIIGLGIKAGLVPAHFWMPLAHGAAPMPASAVLSGVIVKASIIAMVRFLPFAVALPGIGRPLAMVGAFGAFYGVAVGITQSRPKLVLAYSTVSQMGFLIGVVGMGLSEGDTGTGLAAAAYAAHHLLVKGALFLAVGVMASTGRDRRWSVIVPAAIIALGLGGLPLTGGALTKYVVKGFMGEGLASAVAFGSSAATTLLMLHFLRLLLASMSKDAGARAPAGLWWPWLTMAVGALALPWWLFLRVPNDVLPRALAPASLWSALVPVLVGAGLAVVLDRFARRLPRVPEGDIGVGLDRLCRMGAAAAGGLLERVDALTRQWAVAGITLLAVAALFGWALAVSP